MVNLRYVSFKTYFLCVLISYATVIYLQVTFYMAIVMNSIKSTDKISDEKHNVMEKVHTDLKINNNDNETEAELSLIFYLF